MKLSVQLLRLGLVLTVLALVAAQCANPTESEEIAVATAVPEVPVSYVSFFSNGAASTVDIELIERSQQAYPHLNVSRTGFANPFGDYLTAPSSPDVMTWLAGDALEEAGEAGLIVDLSDIWLEQGWDEVYPEALQTMSQVNGRYHFLPTSLNWVALFYNRSVFEQYGLEPPDTWEELLEVSETLRNNGVTPISLGASGTNPTGAFLWFDYLNLRLNGLEFRNSFFTGEERFDDPQIREVFETWQLLIDNEYLTDRPQYKSSTDAYLAVAEGEAGMTLAAPNDLFEIVPATRWNDLSFVRFPVINPDIPVAEIVAVAGYVIPANAAEVEAALDFVTYRGSLEAQAYSLERLGLRGGIPARNDLDPAMLTSDVQNAQGIIQDADQFAPLYTGFNSAIIRSIWRKGAFQTFFRDPNNLDDVLADMEEVRQTVSELQ